MALNRIDFVQHYHVHRNIILSFGAKVGKLRQFFFSQNHHWDPAWIICHNAHSKLAGEEDRSENIL